MEISHGLTSNGDSVENGRTFTCVIIMPTSTASHLKRVHESVRSERWQSTSAHNDTEAWNFLKTRTWDLVLVDETFSSLISDFREWESKQRSRRQENLIVVTESVDQTSSGPDSQVQPPEGFDEVIGKPIGLTTLRKLLRKKAATLSTKAQNGHSGYHEE
jgi:DNA-binding response OmpR family regulator